MARYDSNIFLIPRVPFIIELPILCFKVVIPLSTYEQQIHLPYFDLIQTPTKHKFNKIGHKAFKAFNFFAFNEGFILTGKDGYKLIYEPHDWYIERELALDSPSLSLDTKLAINYEAWKIYTKYLDCLHGLKIKQITDDLRNHKVKIDYIKKIMPELVYILKAKVIPQEINLNSLKDAIIDNVLIDRAIKTTRNRKGEREKFYNIDLLVSYKHILEAQPASNKSQIKAIKEAVKLIYPHLEGDALANKEKTFEKKLKKKAKIHH